MYPIPDNSTAGLVGIFNYANEVTQNWYAIGFAFSFPLIVFVTLRAKGYRASDSFSTAFVLAFVISVMEFAASVLQGKYVILILILMVLSFIWTLFDE